jgi:hypothetical protein
MVIRAMLLIAFAAFLITGITRADDAPNLAGSAIKTKDAAAKSDAVFVGEVTQLGNCIWANPNFPLFIGTNVKVLHVLRGSVGGHILITITLNDTYHEELPAAGRTYIFFVINNKNTEAGGLFADPFTALKLLAVTDDNIAMVKKLILN